MALKPENSRLNVFFILYALKKHSDLEHPISAAEIVRIINIEFGHLSPIGKIISVDTVKRTLDELIDKVFIPELGDEQLKNTYGYCVSCVSKDGEGYRTYDMINCMGLKRYYYYDSDFSMAEIETLKDAMETYNYFSEEDITNIISKLLKIRPKSFSNKQYYDVAKTNREEDSLLLMNIDMLYDIILKKKCAKIVYCAYDVNKKLVPRQGYPKVIEPIYLMWSNGYYYLLAYHEKYNNIVSLRVDRITDIEEIEAESNHPTIEFNPVQYRYEHPVMYSGDKENMVLLCRDTGKNYIMNTIIDVFGKKAIVAKAEDDILVKYLHHDSSYYQEQGIVWLRVSINTSPGGVELWATQYCYDCVIISPEKSRVRVRERIEIGNQYYRE